MYNNEYNEYKKFISKGINITEGFNLTSITEDNYIMFKILSSDESKNKDNNLQQYLSSAFIYDNSYCLIVLFDYTPKAFFGLIEYWFESPWVQNDEIIEYIHNAKRFIVYKFDLNWWNEFFESKYSCELELEKMKPIIRKLKIQKLLK